MFLRCIYIRKCSRYLRYTLVNIDAVSTRNILQFNRQYLHYKVNISALLKFCCKFGVKSKICGIGILVANTSNLKPIVL